MIGLEMKNYNMIVTETQQKYKHYYQVKIDKYEYFTGEKYCLLIKEGWWNKLRLHILC